MPLAKYVLKPGEDPLFQVRFYGPFAQQAVAKHDSELADDIQFALDVMVPTPRRHGRKPDFVFALGEVRAAHRLLRRRPRTQEALFLLRLLKEAVEKVILIL